ncbi:MAG: hypothetical protein KatS3mg003_1439 [Candidatus Nitrosocaldaceae archaeon]|nr:MAG: hypothetical protein KatS3mg003_1170 [Candidatus Nitrosocaldaceae archaeon]GIU71960.1 MAG: hypothetical protein KatS3mg003_1439 [Candidatus Nitrosocaldaceae archaeon]
MLFKKKNSIRVLIRNGKIIKLAKGFIDGKTIVADGKVWTLDKINPYTLIEGIKKDELVILDENNHIEYRFKDLNIEPTLTDPKTLKVFTNSMLIRKLLGIKQDPFISIMIFFMGMFVLMILQQYIPSLTNP